MNDTKEFCKDDLTRLTKAIGYIIRVYYGLNVDNLDADLIRVTIQTIMQRHPNITFEELNLSYSERTIEKRQGVSLTRDEIMQPIEDMARKKGLILSVSEQEKRKLEEKESEQQEKQRFKEESYALYIDCLNNKKEWSGTPFQAASFADNFKELFTREEKDVLWSECQLQAERMRIEAANVIDATLPISARHLFCDEIIRRALKRGLDGYYLIKD